MPISQTGGARIKSIQRGTVNMSGVMSTTATIAAVDMAKTELRFAGFDAIGSNDPVRVQLTSSTQITVFRSTAGGMGGGPNVTWELTEYF